MALLAGALSHKLKDCGFDSQSGHYLGGGFGPDQGAYSFYSFIHSFIHSSIYLLTNHRWISLLILEREEGSERNTDERETSIAPRLGTEPATQACALTGNRLIVPLVYRTTVQPTEPQWPARNPEPTTIWCNVQHSNQLSCLLRDHVKHPCFNLFHIPIFIMFTLKGLHCIFLNKKFTLTD